MENYFNYFTEIEEHFQKRRGDANLLSPLDWALIESFHDSGIPLEVVLKGVDQAFTKYEQRKKRIGKINSLSYCTQAILKEQELLQQNSVGKGHRSSSNETVRNEERENLLEMLSHARDQLRQAADKTVPLGTGIVSETFQNILDSLETINHETQSAETIDYERLEMRLSLLEEKILSALIASMSDDALISLRDEVNQELRRHKRKLKAEHLAMLEKKMMSKKVLESYGVPRLSLFYLPLN